MKNIINKWNDFMDKAGIDNDYIILMVKSFAIGEVLGLGTILVQDFITWIVLAITDKLIKK